jgi:hypothetical protein
MNTCIHPTLFLRLRPLAIFAFAFAGAFLVHAQTPAVFGMVGVTASDTARLKSWCFRVLLRLRLPQAAG